MRKILAILLLWCSVAMASHTITFTGDFTLNNVVTEADTATLYIYWYGAKVDSPSVAMQEADYEGMYIYSFDTDSGTHGWSGIWMFNDIGEAVWVLDAADVTFAADSGTASITETDIKTIANRVYDTLYIHADDFKSGAGSGPDPLVVYVLDAADSTAIWPAKVVANSKPDYTGSKYVTGTSGGGHCTFSLLDGDSIFLQAIATQYYIPPDTFPKGAGLEACSLWATGLSIPAPADPTLCTVYGNLRSIVGNDSVNHAQITFVWDHVATDPVNGLILGNKAETVESDSTGFFEAELFTTTALHPSDLKWRVEISHSKQFKPKWKAEFEIPADSAGATFDLSSLNYGIGGY